MFSLIYGFYQYWFQKDEYYVVIIGLDNAGKTVKLLMNWHQSNLSKTHRGQGYAIAEVLSMIVNRNLRVF